MKIRRYFPYIIIWGRLDILPKIAPNWKYFFSGMCIGQFGFGFVWRKKNG